LPICQIVLTAEVIIELGCNVPPPLLALFRGLVVIITIATSTNSDLTWERLGVGIQEVGRHSMSEVAGVLWSPIRERVDVG
jgi:hypothetical protein